MAIGVIFLGGFLMARPKTILEKAWQSFGSIGDGLTHEMISQQGVRVQGPVCKYI